MLQEWRHPPAILSMAIMNMQIGDGASRLCAGQSQREVFKLDHEEKRAVQQSWIWRQLGGAAVIVPA
jgi:hypothetical protein